METVGMTPIGEILKSWREDRGILRFVDSQFGVQLDSWQERALLAIASPKVKERRVALQACTGPGKSAVLAWAGWWFLGCQGEKFEHPQGAAVAITGDNLRDNLWKEYAKWHQRSAYLRTAFTWTGGRIFANDHPETWFFSARSFPKKSNADEQGATLSGLHSKYVMAQVDESGAIPTTILRAAEQALSRCSFGKIVQAGNPISLEGMLYAAANELRSLWIIIRVTGDPDDPEAWVHSPRVGPEPLAWAKQQVGMYGRENPWVKSYILGQFPAASLNSLLGIEEVEAAMGKHLTEDVYDWAQKRIGVDVARFGDDRTVLFPRQGMATWRPIVMRNVRTTNIAARVAQGQDAWAKDGELPLVFVDDTGHWGHGVIDNLLTAGRPAFPVVFSDPALDPRYRNRRAEMWMVMAEWVKNGGALPNVRELVAELTTPTYTFLNGKFILEEKDLIKKRLGRSPDLADALALTFAIPDMPNQVMSRLQNVNTTLHERDPFASIGKLDYDRDPYRSGQ
jgi:hypothetical protein